MTEPWSSQASLSSSVFCRNLQCILSALWNTIPISLPTTLSEVACSTWPQFLIPDCHRDTWYSPPKDFRQVPEHLMAE
jgi:hypothetical protein